jgi:hypothetical protein
MPPAPFNFRPRTTKRWNMVRVAFVATFASLVLASYLDIPSMAGADRAIGISQIHQRNGHLVALELLRGELIHCRGDGGVNQCLEGLFVHRRSRGSWRRLGLTGRGGKVRKKDDREPGDEDDSSFHAGHRIGSGIGGKPEGWIRPGPECAALASPRRGVVYWLDACRNPCPARPPRTTSNASTN